MSCCLIWGQELRCLHIFNGLFSFAHQITTSAEVANLQELPGSTAPMPGFDPLDIADVGSVETFAWMQAA